MSRLRAILDYQAEQDERVQRAAEAFRDRLMAQLIDQLRSLKPLDPNDYIFREGDRTTSAKDK